MRFLLVVLTALAILGGVAIFLDAKTALHEIEAFILFLIAAVLMSGASVAQGLILLRRDLGRLPSRFATSETFYVKWKGAAPDYDRV